MHKIVSAAIMMAALSASSSVPAQRGSQGPATRDAYLTTQKERIGAMDADHDGVVTKAEMTAQMAERMGEAPAQDRVDMLFGMIDTDGDGKATAAEADAAAAARFTALDTDHDGTLSPEERRAGMAAMMGRHQ